MTLIGIITAMVTFIVGLGIGARFVSFGAPNEFDRTEAREAVYARTEKRKDRILARANEQGCITNDDVEDLFCISDSTARNYLNELEEEGKLSQHGESGRGVYYTPIH